MTEYERGDVIEAGDPFTQEPASRPFVIINTESHPFDGEQYVVTHADDPNVVRRDAACITR